MMPHPRAMSRLGLWGLLGLLAAGCAPAGRRGAPAGVAAAAPAMLTHRAVPPPGGAPAEVVAAIPHARWDRGLAQAAGALVALAAGGRAPTDVATRRAVLDRAAFPGPASFAQARTAGELPQAMIDEIIVAAAGAPVDIGLASRTWGDGSVLWVVGWAAHHADLKPIPQQVGLDDTVPVAVYPTDRAAPLTLFLAPPDGVVEAIPLDPGVDRWLDRFHTPGAYRLEVVQGEGTAARVVLLWSVFVDGPPPAPPPPRPPPTVNPDPAAAEAKLYAALDALRRARGLPALQRFPLFEPLAREHSALLAARGVVAHAVPGAPGGVPARAARVAHPRARHLENVAAALDADEAMALVVDSPGHLQALLCTACSHVAIGAALEPVLDRRPRLFVTWELLAFPEGPPQPIDRLDR